MGELHGSPDGKLPAQPVSPVFGNTQGINDTRRGVTGYLVEEVAARGGPEDYFYRIALDTLQVSVKGEWRNRDGAVALLEKRRAAEFIQQVGLGASTYGTPDGRKLTVYPHGARPSYNVLLRDGDGLEIRAIPKGKLPAFVFRFGARWCVENPLVDLGQWAVEFAQAAGFEPQKVQLSEAHIRCDCPTPFTESDLKLMRGAGTRHGRFNAHMHGGKLSGIDNLGGSKHIKFCIYDKRLEQKQKEGAFWPAVWKSYGIASDVPIWRVEARWDRKSLGSLGMDAFADLNEHTMRGLWYAFSTRYLSFVSRPGKRTDRSPVSRKWQKIQSCGKMMEARAVAAKIGATSTQLMKQAVGCVAKALAVSGNGYAESVMQELIDHAVRQGHAQFQAGRTEYLGRMLKDILDRFPADAFMSAEHMRVEIENLIASVLDKKALAQPFDGKTTSIKEAKDESNS